MVSLEHMRCVDEPTIDTLNALSVGLVLARPQPEPRELYNAVRNATLDAAERMRFEQYAGYGDDDTEGVIMRRRIGRRWEYVHLWLSFGGVGGSLLDEWPYVKLDPIGFDQQIDAAYDSIMQERESK